MDSLNETSLSFPRRCFRRFLCALVKLVLRPRVCGPAPDIDEPVIFACRHVGYLDPVALMAVYIRKIVRPLIAKDYFDKNRLVRFFYRQVMCIPIDRRKVSTQWLDDSLTALARGEHVLIFPEGKRNKSGKGLLPFHNGVTLLAARSGARIVPVWNAAWKLPHRYRLAIGEPFTLASVPPEGVNAAWLREQTNRIKEAVAALEPLTE